MTKIFISYQRNDELVAKLLDTYLRKCGLDTYLDVFDSDLTGDGIILTKRIREMLELSSHLLTVLSENTQKSWWVPFEIGIATEKDRPIANYFHDVIQVPGYLEFWPYLRNAQDFDRYIQMVNRHKELIEKSASMQKKLRISDMFHMELKKSLGQ